MFYVCQFKSLSLFSSDSNIIIISIYLIYIAKKPYLCEMCEKSNAIEKANMCIRKYHPESHYIYLIYKFYFIIVYIIIYYLIMLIVF